MAAGTVQLTISPATNLESNRQETSFTETFQAAADDNNISDLIIFNDYTCQYDGLPKEIPEAIVTEDIGGAFTYTYIGTGYGPGGPPTNAGTYTVIALYVSDTWSGTKNAELTIGRKLLEITGVTVADREYNGSTDITLSGGSLVGIVPSDIGDVDFYLGDGTISSADVGINKPVTTNITLIGGKSRNYTLAQPDKLTVNIALADYNYYVDTTQSIKVGSELSVFKKIAPENGTNIGENPVDGVVEWFRDVERNYVVLESDVNSLEVTDPPTRITLYWRFKPNNSNYMEKTGSTTFTIVDGDPQPMTFTQPETVTKTYGDATFVNVAMHDDGSDTKGAITYSSKNTSIATVDPDTGAVTIVGAGSAVIVATAAAVPGTWAETTKSYNLIVNKKTPDAGDFAFTLPETATYNESPHSVTVAAGSGITGLGAIIAVRYNDSETAPTNAGEYHVTVEVAEGVNYRADNKVSLGSFTISPKEVESVDREMFVKADVGYTFEYEFDLTSLLPPEIDAGQVSAYSCLGVWRDFVILDGIPEVSDAAATINIPIRGNARASQQATITIGFTIDNYTITNAVITATVTDKTIVGISGVTVNSRVYNGSKISYNASGITFTDIINGDRITTGIEPIYKWSNGSEAPTNAGWYTLTVSADGGTEYVINPFSVGFNIEKAPLTLQADNKSITVNTALPTFTFTVRGLVAPDSWQTVGARAPDVECPEANAAQAGSYPISINRGSLNIDAGANYEIKNYTNGTLTVTSSGVSGGNDTNSGSSIGGQDTPLVESPDDEDETPLNPFPFTDVVEGNWFYEDVEFVFNRGLMIGTADDIFEPNTSLTRGMIVTVLYRYIGSPDVSDLSSPFNDVAADVWYTDAIIWAAKNEIVLGYGDGNFGPNDHIIRQDLAVILYRYAVFADITLPVTREYEEFLDDPLISDYAKEAVEVFYEAEIINGKLGGIFDPRGDATRAEVAAMMHKFIKCVEEADVSE